MIDTTVEGSVSDVRSVAIWLRESLEPKLSSAGDLAATGRRTASSQWEGKDADAYSSYALNIVTLTDDHAARVGRAATACDSYATRLRTMKGTMRGLRDRATAGGLVVTGDDIAEPPEVPATVVEPGSPEETAHEAAVAKVELYNTLATEATTARSSFDDWIQVNLIPDVTDAEEDGGVSKVMGEIKSLLPNFLAGATAGYSGLVLAGVAENYKAKAREFRRKSRVSGDPRIRGQANTPAGRGKLDDLLGKARKFGKFAKFLGGPVGIGIDIIFGIKEAHETGDWTRAALTTGTSIAVGLGVTALVAAGVVTAPAWLVVAGAGALAAGAAWGVGKIYDNWDDITGWTGDRWDDVAGWTGDRWDDASELAGDTWEGAKDLAGDAKDKAGDAWDAVTPW